ncbi:salicylate hydroxylase [Penicillium malachiteum]|uniref:salicylate hydroxylase n=1 Tax=Penicillium malachiteum TaxID=1324776 RepID=UPI0025468EED|nr:salicylate hydroxylase [Penicillium malachiteum]KAJ5714631.1 salicylate hydroxylase [Penicillium malachiteum]
MPLKIIIVGAGIGGLSAATALRQAGHQVEVFEKSKFLSEVGAALTVAPNGVRILSSLGFSFENARSQPKSCFELRDGRSFEIISSVITAPAERTFGAPLYTMQRADLHEELFRIATSSFPGLQDISLHLGTKVCSVDPFAGTVQLEDGSFHIADIVIGADGLHSILKPAVLNMQPDVPVSTDLTAFRFQLPTDALSNDPDFRDLILKKGDGPSIMADVSDDTTLEHIVWYDCQNGEVQNFVGMIQNDLQPVDKDPLDSLLFKFDHFHPGLMRVISKAPTVTKWPLKTFRPLRHWSRGKLLLIGDAAHPMLPFSGQGANQAIEDAGALRILFDHLDSPDEIPAILSLFENLRRLRVSRIQTLSSMRIGKEGQIQEELQKYADYPVADVPKTFPERLAHDFSYDILEITRAKLREYKIDRKVKDTPSLGLHF